MAELELELFGEMEGCLMSCEGVNGEGWTVLISIMHNESGLRVVAGCAKTFPPSISVGY